MSKGKESGTARIISDGEAVTIVGSKSVIRIGLKPKPSITTFRLNSTRKAEKKQVVSVTQDNITHEEAPFGCSKIGAGGVVFTVTDNTSQGGESGDK